METSLSEQLEASLSTLSINTSCSSNSSSDSSINVSNAIEAYSCMTQPSCGLEPPSLTLSQHYFSSNSQLLSNNDSEVDLDDMLSLACRQGKQDIVELLLENGACFSRSNKAGNTPLLEACSQGHVDVARVLLDRNADINKPTETTSDSPLTWACTLGQEAIVNLLLQRKANVEHRTKDGCTALMFAALAGHVCVVNLLLEKGANLNVESDSNKDSPLTFACWKGHVNVVELLLSRGANIEHRTKEGFTPLMFAALGGHTEVARLLLKNNAKVNEPSGSNNDIPLTSACWKGHHEVVELLLDSSSYIEHRTKDGCTPLMLASREGHLQVAKLILAKDAQVNQPSGSENNIPLTLACWKGHCDVVELLLRYKSVIEHRNKAGCSPLMLAAREGHFHATFLLLKEGADINQPSGSNDDTPLTLACWKGHDKVVQLLLEKRSNIDHQTKTGCTPLMEATREGHCKVAALLLDHGADVETPDNYGQSPLFMACWKGHADVAELLLRYEATKDCKTKTGITPLFQACRENHVEVVRLLLDYGCSVNSSFPNSKECPLTLSAEKGFNDLVLLLLRYGVLVNCKTKKGCTPFFLSCKEGHLELSKALYEHSACPESSDYRNTTPLVAAFRNGHFKVVEWLLTFVNHLPSDEECRKTLTPSAFNNDKELSNSKNRCHELIRKAKLAKETAAMHVAKILCDEVDAEKEKHENRKKAQARKNLKRKEKKRFKREKTSGNKNNSLVPNSLIPSDIQDCQNVSTSNPIETNSIFNTDSFTSIDDAAEPQLNDIEKITPTTLLKSDSSPSDETINSQLSSEPETSVENKLNEDNGQNKIQISNCSANSKSINSCSTAKTITTITINTTNTITNNNNNNNTITNNNNNNNNNNNDNNNNNINDNNNSNSNSNNICTGENSILKAKKHSCYSPVNQEIKPSEVSSSSTSSPLDFSPIHSPLNSLSRVTNESTLSTEVTSFSTEVKQPSHSTPRSPESRFTNHKNNSKSTHSNSNNNNSVYVHNTAKATTSRYSTTSAQNSKMSINVDKNNDYSNRRRSSSNLKIQVTSNTNAKSNNNNNNSISNHAPLKRKASSPSITQTNSTDTLSKRTYSTSFNNQIGPFVSSNNKSSPNVPTTSHSDNYTQSTQPAGSWDNAATPTTNKVTPISPATYSQVTSKAASTTIGRTSSPLSPPTKPPLLPKDSKSTNTQQEYSQNDSKYKQPALNSFDSIRKQKSIDSTSDTTFYSDDDMESANNTLIYNNSNSSKSKMLPIQVSHLQVGRVIGKGGSRINDITNISGAHIRVSKPPNVKNQDRIITIKGNDKSITIAHHLITEALSTPDTEIDFHQIALKEGIISLEVLAQSTADSASNPNSNRQTTNSTSEPCLAKNSSSVKSQTIENTNILIDRPESIVYNSPQQQPDFASPLNSDASTDFPVSSPVKNRFGAIGQEMVQPQLSTFITSSACNGYNYTPTTTATSDSGGEHTFGAIGQPSRHQSYNYLSSNKEVINPPTKQYSTNSITPKNGFVDSFLSPSLTVSPDLPVSPVTSLTQSVWNFDPSSLQNSHSTSSWWPSLNMSSNCYSCDNNMSQDNQYCWNDKDIKSTPLSPNPYGDMNGDSLYNSFSGDNDDYIWRNISPSSRSHSQTSNYCSYSNDYLSDNARDLVSCEDLFNCNINGELDVHGILSSFNENRKWPRVEDLIMKKEDRLHSLEIPPSRRAKFRTHSKNPALINGQAHSTCKDVSDQISMAHLSGCETQSNYSLT